MIIDAYLLPTSFDSEQCFANAIVVMIDVLRAGTTVTVALSNGAKELIVTDTTEKAVKLYNTLSRGAAFLGGERGGLKPSGFDAGNSPCEYLPDSVKDKVVILTTTNGTVVFQNAKEARFRIIGGFVNISSVVDFIRSKVNADSSIDSIVILASGNKGKLSYEDTIAAGAFVSKLSDLADKITDSAKIAQDIYKCYSQNFVEFLKSTEHAMFLAQIGFNDDIELSLSTDTYPIVPIVNGNNVKIAN